MRRPSLLRVLAGLARATHPLPALAVTTLVGVVTATRDGRLSTLGWVIASTAVGQASIGWSNDYLDRERDAAAGRRDKPLVAGEVAPGAVAILASIAFPLSAVLSLPLGVAPASVMLAAVTSAWAYNLGLKGTPLSAVPYAVSFGLAPVYIWLATSGSSPPGWIVAAGALLGTAAHLLNALPDFETDHRGHMPGLVHRLGFRASLLLACGVLAALLVVILVADGVAASGGQLAAGAIAAV
ncbi:MAG: UbiA family prenyltransferase, partial [Actinomycetota bacterium]